MPNRTLAKLGKDSAHRMSMIRTMCGQLIMNNSIKTTYAKAKALRPVVERLVTLSKSGGLHARRKAKDFLRNDDPVDRLWKVMPERYSDRNGGYCRITKLYNREGDDALMAKIELINESVAHSRAKKAAKNFIIKERLQWKKEYYHKMRNGIEFDTPVPKLQKE